MLNDEEKTNTPDEPETADRQNVPEKSEVRSAAEEFKRERARLQEENRLLGEEIARLMEENRAIGERAAGLDALKRLTCGEDRLYEEAVKRADGDETLRALPASKRYAVCYYLLLGERAQRNIRLSRGEQTSEAPLFMHSGGSGVSPASELPEPKTFASAKENAKKYFGGV